jgi:hypothetical protein
MSFLRQFLDMLTYPLRALLSTPSRLFAGSKRLLGMSLPARVAWVVAVFLVICVTITLVAFYYTQNRSFVQAKLTPTFFIIVIVLLAVIPFVLYKALKLWLEGEISPFPDIDHAWKAGLAELRQHGIDLMETPLFLVFGSASESQEKGIFGAAGLSLNVREFPKGPAALHWYANADGVYLVCSDVGCLSKAANLGRQAEEEDSARPGPVAPRSGGDAFRGTIVAGGSSPSLTSSAVVPSAPSSPPSAARSSGSGNIRGTMVVGGGTESDVYDAGPAPKEKRIVRLEPNDITLQERRLEYLCRLIRRARLPLSPLNGALALLPFGLIGRSVPESNEVGRAAKRDTAVLLRGLMVRCPVTALVAGMEEHPGFQELVRRVGHDRAAGQRFGKGFTLTNPPQPERLEALAAHACGAFEDWVYTLFREKGSLSKPGNTRLYSLLCKIRRDVQTRLANILAIGFGCESENGSQEESLFFGGCYFAATGETEDRQAFVRGVFDKLPEQQEELDWTGRAIGEEQKYQFLSNLCLGLDTVLLFGLAALIVNKWFYKFW